MLSIPLLLIAVIIARVIFLNKSKRRESISDISYGNIIQKENYLNMKMNTHKNNIKLSKMLINFAIIMIIIISVFAIDSPNKLIYAINLLFYTASIILGCKGITGEDMKDKTNHFFDWQAKTGLIGISFF